MKRRVMVAGLFTETNTFVDDPTPLRDFIIARDEELFRSEGNASPMGGFLETARAYGWEVIPTVDYRASPGGTVDDEVFETFWSEFEKRAKPILGAGIDGIYLVLHGAMVTQSLPDVEGEFLRRLRGSPGAHSLPLFGVFDLHANFTKLMADHADCLVAYRENPHTDARESSVRATALLRRSLESGIRPRMIWRHPAILWPATGTGTADEPMRTLERVAREHEKKSEAIWEASIVAGFAHADTPDAGVSFVVTGTSDQAAAAALDELENAAWSLREKGLPAERTIAEAVDQFLADRKFPAVLVEPSDNIGGGAPGDCTSVLRALLEKDIDGAASAINDPEAVRLLQKIKPGETLSLFLGGKGSRLDPGPVEIKATLVRLTDGKFELEDKQSHMASMLGDFVDMGPSAVVTAGKVTILITSNKTAPMDLGQWRSQGLDPAKFSIINVKAAVAHRRAYDKIARSSVTVTSPGPCSSAVASLPYRQLHRPIYPLDPINQS